MLAVPSFFLCHIGRKFYTMSNYDKTMRFFATVTFYLPLGEGNKPWKYSGPDGFNRLMDQRKREQKAWAVANGATV